MDRRLTSDVRALQAEMRWMEKFSDERDKRYEERDRANKEALRVANASLTEYKGQSNEWRGLANDVVTKAATREDTLREFGELKKQIADLRESRSGDTGRDDAMKMAQDNKRWVIGTAIMIAMFVIAQLAGLFN